MVCMFKAIHYCKRMYLTKFEIEELDLAHFIFAPGLAWEAALNNTKVKLDLSADTDMILTVEKGIRGGICHSI